MIIHLCPDYRLNLDGECLICKLEKHCDELEIINKELKQALKFTTKAAVHLFKPNEPLQQGLPPFHYFTLTYEGDLELIENTKSALKLLESKCTQE